MNRILLYCLSSAVLGGVVTAWLTNDDGMWSLEQSAHAQISPIPSRQSPLPRERPNLTLLSSQTVDPPTALTEEEQTNIRAYEAANRSVVNINTRIVSFDYFMLPTAGQGSGSGSVLDKQGHILTNAHVIEDAREIQVTLSGGQTYQAEIVGTDTEYDLTVLRIDAPPEQLTPIAFGTSDQLKVGQRVYALGNPFGLEGTLTTGIISSLNRTLPSRVSGHEMKSIIQTDAALNPGNSGGPLLDTSGRMIGMNVAIATKSGQNAGAGFAIPINRIRRFVPELIERGKIVRPYIGISVVNETDQGLQIVRTNQGGPADGAGLRGWRQDTRKVRRGPLVYTVDRPDPTFADYVLAIDGQAVSTASEFQEKIEQHKPGDTIVLTILRQGRRIDVPVTLDEA